MTPKRTRGSSRPPRAGRRSARIGCVVNFSADARAQAWPQKPIRLLVGFAPGGGTDIVARTLGQRMSELLGQPVVVENRAGASGTIAADVVAKSPPDGYTLLVGHSNSNAIAPFVLKNVPYDAASDFTADHLHRLRAERARRQSRRARQVRDRAGRAREVEARRDDVCVVRRRQHAASRRRAVREADRHEDQSRAVQGQRPGGRRPHRAARST